MGIRCYNNKRDRNNNIVYYESKESNSRHGNYIVKHYQEYDSANRKIKYYNTLNQCSTYEYNDKNVLIKKEDYKVDDTSGYVYYSRSDYDSYGNLVSHLDNFKGHTIETTYYPNERKREYSYAMFKVIEYPGIKY